MAGPGVITDSSRTETRPGPGRHQRKNDPDLKNHGEHAFDSSSGRQIPGANHLVPQKETRNLDSDPPRVAKSEKKNRKGEKTPEQDLGRFEKKTSYHKPHWNSQRPRTR